MTSSGEKTSNYARRFIWLSIAIVVAIGVYTAGWHYAAGLVIDRVHAGIARANKDGRRANCENAQMRGYPFRIGIFCQSVLFEDARAGVALRARSFRSAAQVYAPTRAIMELDSPATIQVPGLNALDVGWSALRASVRLARPLPERLSIEGKDITVAFDEPGEASPPVGQAGSAEFHVRPAGDDLEVAARFAELTVDPALVRDAAVPPLSGLVDMSVTGGASRLGTQMASLNGASGVLRELAISIDPETGVTIRGPVSINGAGLVDADLEITLRNPGALARLLGDAMPESRQEIELGLNALASGGDAVTLPLRITKGEVSLGFLSLGAIPPL